MTLDKVHEIHATFYMKSGNVFTLKFDKFKGDRKGLEWTGAGDNITNEQLHDIDLNQVEAITYKLVEVSDD